MSVLLRKRLCAAVVAATMIGAAPQVGAQVIVQDPNAIEQLISQLTALNTQITNEKAMLAQLGSDFAPTVLSLAQQTQTLTAQLNAINSNYNGVQTTLNTQFPTNFSGQSGTQVLANLNAMQAQVQQAYQMAYAIQGQIVQNQAQVSTTVNSAVRASNTAQGQTAVGQATNQILGAQSQQLQDIQSSLVAQHTAQQQKELANSSEQNALQQMNNDLTTQNNKSGVSF